MQSELGWDRGVWAEVCEMGWAGLTVPEDHGGAGLGWVALVGLLEETGQALFCGPLLSTALAQAALTVGGDEAQRGQWLPLLASGERTGALALGDGVSAREQGGGWRVDGLCPHVTDGGSADLLVIEAGDGLFVVRAQDTERRTLTTVDPTRRQAEIHLHGVPAQPLSPGIVDRMRCLAATAVAAEQAGGARACLHMATGYAKVREQFGRPIGSFQAVQHMCADMMVRAESARSAAWYAGWAADEAPEELPLAAAAARVYCSEAYLFCAGQNIQVHGGIGFSWEHDAHLHLKRARSTLAMLGDPSRWRARYADAKGI